jgi:FtsH-binding integral membrane protein
MARVDDGADMSNREPGRDRRRFAQIVVALVVLAVYLPTAVAGAALAVALATNPLAIGQRPWWANLWGAAGVALIAWLAWRNRDLAAALPRRALASRVMARAVARSRTP